MAAAAPSGHKNPPGQVDGWDSAFDRVEVDGRGKERPVSALSPRQVEYANHIKKMNAEIAAKKQQ